MPQRKSPSEVRWKDGWFHTLEIGKWDKHNGSLIVQRKQTPSDLLGSWPQSRDPDCPWKNFSLSQTIRTDLFGL